MNSSNTYPNPTEGFSSTIVSEGTDYNVIDLTTSELSLLVSPPPITGFHHLYLFKLPANPLVVIWII